MLDNSKAAALIQLAQSSSRDELMWMHGYLSGVLGHQGQNTASASASGATLPGQEPPNISRFTLAYGTETGNSKALAISLAKRAKQEGFQTKLVALDQYRLKDLAKEGHFFLILSTQGDGEPPAAALKFFDHIKQKETALSGLRYSVLGLGDTAYPLFCQAGVDADQFLSERGAERLTPLVKCNVDYEADANRWFGEVLAALKGSPPPAAAQAESPKNASAKAIYQGEVLTNIDLNDAPSAKETHHIEIRCEGDVDYLPGDAAGFIPLNPKPRVDQVLQLLGKTGEEAVSFREFNGTLREVLEKKANLSYLPERVIQKYATLTGQKITAGRIDFEKLLCDHPANGVDLAALLEVLEPIAPRLYSISSSPAAHPGEVHLTVARNHFALPNDEVGTGLCSDYLNRLPEGSEIEFYIHKSRDFKLPAPEADILMIGPGTGIAPFRSFLFEREAAGATGRNWLFFGEQHFTTDFLYQTELQDFLKTGTLHQLDVAFSRDQKEKIYVQHRLLENGAEVYRWMESGASIYVCGTRDPMSVDVEAALLKIIEDHGELSPEDAASYLRKLADEKRYVKDVY